MLRVKTRIKPSKISGFGLFADQLIPAGTITWQYDQGFDPSFSVEQFKALPDFTQEYILIHGYFDHDKEVYILCADNQAYINHSNDPNIKSTPDADIAIRDIEPGEELVCNYKEYEADWFNRRQDFSWSHFE